MLQNGLPPLVHNVGSVTCMPDAWKWVLSMSSLDVGYGYLYEFRSLTSSMSPSLLQTEAREWIIKQRTTLSLLYYNKVLSMKEQIIFSWSFNHNYKCL